LVLCEIFIYPHPDLPSLVDHDRVSRDEEPADLAVQLLKPIEHGNRAVQVIGARDILVLSQSRFAVLEIYIQDIG
jgi:hypothetical protein